MGRRAKDVLIVLVLTLLFASGLKSCVVDAYKIPSESMHATLMEGDYLLVNKFVYGARSPQKIFFFPLPHIQFPKWNDIRRGDVVVFHFPGEPNEIFPVKNLFMVKRIVGLPGDTVEVTDGSVRVQDEALRYFGTVQHEFSKMVIPKKGDQVSLSRSTIDRWKVLIQREGSTVELHGDTVVIDQRSTGSYTFRKNYYFVLGDNVNNSSDSREWGCVPEENIIGKGMMIYWSKNSDGIRWDRIGTIVR